MAAHSKEPYIGVYALIIESTKILLVRKRRGPYTGMLDLPGGFIEFGEDVKDALIREVKEETGVILKDIQPFENFSCQVLWKEKKKETLLHHIGIIYFALSYDRSNYKEKVDLEDVESTLWIDFSEIDENKISKMLYLVLKKILG